MYDFDSQVFTLTAEATLAQVTPYCRFSPDGGVSFTNLNLLSLSISGNVMTLEFGAPFPYNTTVEVGYYIQGDATQHTASVSVPSQYDVSTDSVTDLAWSGTYWTFSLPGPVPTNTVFEMQDGSLSAMSRDQSSPDIGGWFSYSFSGGVASFVASPSVFASGGALSLWCNGSSTLSILHA